MATLDGKFENEKFVCTAAKRQNPTKKIELVSVTE